VRIAGAIQKTCDSIWSMEEVEGRPWARSPSTNAWAATTRSRRSPTICLPRLQADAQLGRFWKNRGEDGVAREKQLLVDFLCSSAGGPLYYTGRDMKTSHRGMQISASDWSAFLGHVNATLDAFRIPRREPTKWSPS
jgi:hypothetical protein